MLRFYTNMCNYLTSPSTTCEQNAFILFSFRFNSFNVLLSEC